MCPCCSPSRAVFIATVLTLALSAHSLLRAPPPWFYASPSPSFSPSCSPSCSPSAPVSPSPVPLPPSPHAARLPSHPDSQPGVPPVVRRLRGHDPPHGPAAPSPPLPTRSGCPHPLRLPSHPTPRSQPDVFRPCLHRLTHTHPPCPRTYGPALFLRRWTPSSCATSASARSGWARAARLPSRG